VARVLPSRAKAAADIFQLQMRRRRLIAGTGLVLLLLLTLIGTTPWQSWTMTDADAQGDIVRQVMVLAIVAILPFAPSNARPPMAVPWSLLILLGYCLLTLTWAIEPMVALRRLAFTAVVVWVLVRCIGDLGAVRSLNITRAVLLFVLIVCYGMVWFSPFGVHSPFDSTGVVGDWRGIMPHKNEAGALCALTLLFFIFDRRAIPVWLCAAVYAGAGYFLVMSSSRTSLGVFFVALAAGAAAGLYNPRHRSAILPVALILAVGAIGLLGMYLGVIADLLDDPTSFSGRAAIWPLLLEFASEQLWTGAGYGSFWQIGPLSPIYTLTDGWVATAASHGHNGYLDLLVTIGLPGLILALAVLLVWPALRLLYSYSIAPSRRALLMSILVFCAAHNMSESSLFDRAKVVNVFLLFAVVLIHRISSQSMGRHHALRDRLAQFTGRDQLLGLRRRLGRDARARQSQDAARWAARREPASQEDSIA